MSAGKKPLSYNNERRGMFFIDDVCDVEKNKFSKDSKSNTRLSLPFSD